MPATLRVGSPTCSDAAMHPTLAEPSRWFHESFHAEMKTIKAGVRNPRPERVRRQGLETRTRGLRARSSSSTCVTGIRRRTSGASLNVGKHHWPSLNCNRIATIPVQRGLSLAVAGSAGRAGSGISGSLSSSNRSRDLCRSRGCPGWPDRLCRYLVRE